jgi:hypothetical protein
MNPATERAPRRQVTERRARIQLLTGVHFNLRVVHWPQWPSRPAPSPQKRKSDAPAGKAVASRSVVPKKRDPRQAGIFDAPLPAFIGSQLRSSSPKRREASGGHTNSIRWLPHARPDRPRAGQAHHRSIRSRLDEQLPSDGRSAERAAKRFNSAEVARAGRLLQADDEAEGKTGYCQKGKR